MVMGVALITWTTLLLPVVERRIGTVRMLQSFVGIYVFVVAATPFLHRLAGPRAPRGALWGCLVALFVLRSIAGPSVFTALGILVNNVSASDVGAVNGVATSLTALARACAPVMAGTLLGWSQQHQGHRHHDQDGLSNGQRGGGGGMGGGVAGAGAAAGNSVTNSTGRAGASGGGSSGGVRLRPFPFDYHFAFFAVALVVLGTAVASCRLTPEMGIRIEDREREGETKRVVGNGNGGDTGTTEMSAPEGGRAVASL
jgi:hypothetical protein